MNNRKQVIEFLFKKFDGKCGYCGVEVKKSEGVNPLPDDTATIDHYIPRSQGGTDFIKNLVLACFRCNNDKAKTETINVTWRPKVVPNRIIEEAENWKRKKGW